MGGDGAGCYRRLSQRDEPGAARCVHGSVARQTIRAKYRHPRRSRGDHQRGPVFGGEGTGLSVEANEQLRARRDSLPAFVWPLCGDGPTLDGVRAAAEAHGATNLVFAGRTSEVREVLSASDIFVMPSDFEGMPNAMMEAMVAGLPCVSTRISGATEWLVTAMKPCITTPAMPRRSPAI